MPKSSSLCDEDLLSCLRWSPDWRLVFSARHAADSPSGQASYSLWEIPVKPATAEAAGRPELLVQTGDIEPFAVTITADGKRLAFLKLLTWDDVYLAELGSDGAGVSHPTVSRSIIGVASPRVGPATVNPSSLTQTGMGHGRSTDRA